MSPVLDRPVILVGPGRAGRALARSWIAAGGRIRAVITRDPNRPLPGELARMERLSAASAPLPGCDILVLAVPDDAIADTAASLSGRLSCRFALHLSGALPGEVLAPLRAGGAAVASAHPVRPFTGADGEDWKGAFVAVEGDEQAVELASELSRAIGARPHRLCPADKPLYHAAASLAAGGAAAVLSVGVRLWEAAGIPEAIARETLAGLASRATAAAGARPFAEALTGAVARRDLGTVAAHARALAAHPDALALYRALAFEILARTPGRGREEEIRGALSIGRTDR
jgi:predicted short-subunit dehydrogenase-like oxidoreductase (DUF2520 family)